MPSRKPRSTRPSATAGRTLQFVGGRKQGSSVTASPAGSTTALPFLAATEQRFPPTDRRPPGRIAAARTAALGDPRRRAGSSRHRGSPPRADPSVPPCRCFSLDRRRLLRGRCGCGRGLTDRNSIPIRWPRGTRAAEIPLTAASRTRQPTGGRSWPCGRTTPVRSPTGSSHASSCRPRQRRQHDAAPAPQAERGR